MLRGKFVVGFTLAVTTMAPWANSKSHALESSRAPASDRAKATKVLNPLVTMVAHDPKEKGTRVNLQFSVVDEKGLPVNGLKPGRNGQFRVFFDGVEETSFETLTDASHLAPTVGITMVLDTSLSMEDQSALKPMRRAAERFVKQLSNSKQKFKFNYYQFATDVQRISNLSQINTEKASGRFTSLYSALKIAIQQNPNDIILLFTDGADNKSVDNEQLRVESIAEVETLIKDRQTVVHTVKLGVEDSNDLQGVPNSQVLKRLSVNGSVRYSEQPEELVRAFEAIAARIPSPYYFSYLCPRTSPGKYTLGIEIDTDGVATERGRWTTDLKFDLPFEIGLQRPAITPFSDNWYPILRPDFNPQGLFSGRWSLAGFLPILGHPNGGQLTDLTGHPVGNLELWFDTVDVSQDKTRVQIRYTIKGPTGEMRRLKSLSNSYNVIELRVALMRTGNWGNSEWNTLFGDATPIGALSDHGNDSSFTGGFDLSLSDTKNFMRNSLTITGEYVDSQGLLRVFGVREQSLWHLP